MTKKRAQLVNKKILTNAANKIFIIDDFIIGNSIQINNKTTINNIFSDIFESVLGAIFIDGGMQYAEDFINKHLLLNSNKLNIRNENYKGMLIERCHVLGYQQPVFKIIKNKSKFQADLTVNHILYKGIGDTKKNAESNAAKSALEEIINK